MKKLILFYSILVLSTTSLVAQISENGTFLYLQNAYTLRNSDVMSYLIKECNNYLVSFWDSPDADEVLFMLGNLYEEEKMYPRAFLAYLKIKFVHPSSDRRNDSVSNLNQIVHNKAESTFRDKRKKIDELVSQTLSFTDRNTAYYDLIQFVYELNIEEMNEVLLNDIYFYTQIYSKDAKNPDQLYYWIGDLYKKLSDWHEAILAYKKIQFITPESILIPQAQFSIALLEYNETDEYQKSKDTFIQLISSHPELSIAADAQFYLAELYQEKLDNTNEAVSNYRILVESYPDSRLAVESLKRVGKIMEDNDNYEEAIASYHQIFELYPTNPYAPEALLEIESLYRRKLENYEKAIEVLKLYANQFPEREDAAERLFDAADLYKEELNKIQPKEKEEK